MSMFDSSTSFQYAGLGNRVASFELRDLSPWGCEVHGLDLMRDSPSEDILQHLEEEMASKGVLVFRQQEKLSTDAQAEVTTYFGSHELVTQNQLDMQNPYVLKLSNHPKHGTTGVGGYWHNDGVCAEKFYSHVAFHMPRIPREQGETLFAHAGMAFELLRDEEQLRWSNLFLVGRKSRVPVPLVFSHPRTGKKQILAHGRPAQVTGVLELLDVAGKASRFLGKDDTNLLFQRRDELFNNPAVHFAHRYQEGDLVVFDNLAVAHMGHPSAYGHPCPENLRILHRTCVIGTFELLWPPCCQQGAAALAALNVLNRCE
jgi:taurine dioxygenase